MPLCKFWVQFVARSVRFHAIDVLFHLFSCKLKVVTFLLSVSFFLAQQLLCALEAINTGSRP